MSDSVRECSHTLRLAFRGVILAYTVIAIKNLSDLIDAEKQLDETGLSRDAFVVFWLLQPEHAKEARKVADSASKAFEQNPHWQTNGHEAQEVRKSLYTTFINASVKEAVVEIARTL